ncbi:MAG: YggU family protein [Verrucomicrobia bacterium]|nr:YggU family protein [Verrucomicrobiota bacterium]
MDWIRETAKGVVLPVRAVPRASRNEIQGIHDAALKVRLQAPPVEGKANAALIRFLSDALDIPRSQLSIASGETGRNKAVLITGIKKTELVRKLTEALA